MITVPDADVIQETAIQVVRRMPDLTTCTKKRSGFFVFICSCWWIYDIDWREDFLRSSDIVIDFFSFESLFFIISLPRKKKKFRVGILGAKF